MMKKKPKTAGTFITMIVHNLHKNHSFFLLCFDTYLYVYNTGMTPTSAARLVGGSSMYEGRLQVFQFGAWFTVCDGYWSQRNSDVVCRSIFGDG